MLTANLLLPVLCFVAAGLCFIAGSLLFFRGREPSKRDEHWARSFVGIGIACVSISVALAAYGLKEQGDLEHDRKTVSLNFARAMILYGISARHMDFITSHCALGSSKIVDDKAGCQESGALAIRFSNLLPGGDLAFSQVARGLMTLETLDILRTHLVEGEAALKGRMPVSVENLIRAAVAASPRNAEGAVASLATRAEDFRIKADEMATIYCAFAEATSRSWPAFFEIVQRLDYKSGDVKGASDQLNVFHEKVKDLKVGTVPCEDVPSSIDDLVPIGGGNGSGGGGGN
jgi:hypothetical protein